MASATMATAVGAAALLYYKLNRKLQLNTSDGDDENDTNEPIQTSLGIDRVSHRLIQAPATWLETIFTLSETLRFTYSETLGKWPIGDLAFGIKYFLKRQGTLHVGRVFGGKNSERLTGSEIVAELRYLLKLLLLCWHFSKKPFPLFLEETGYSEDNVLLQEPKAGVRLHMHFINRLLQKLVLLCQTSYGGMILKPAFTILVDHDSKCFLLLIRGTHSIKDTLTSVTGAVVPFHHSVVQEGGVSNLVLGYAHCGMVAAARWISKLAKPCLLKALEQNPGYKFKILGHSLGGGTAAILTYILREQKELSTTTCVTFAPAACMTWELAESGSDFITSVINGADLVPTFSAASVDDLRAEVTASAWINDLRNQIERTRILSMVYRSASALGSRLPSIASAREKVAGAGSILRPVSNGTQVAMKRAQSMALAAWTRPSLRLLPWSCMGPRHRATTSLSESEESSLRPSSAKSETHESLLTSPCGTITTTAIGMTNLPVTSSVGEEWTSECSGSGDMVQDADADADLNNSEDLLDHNGHQYRLTEVELWQELEHELYDRRECDSGDLEKEIREEEEAAIAEVGNDQPESSTPEMEAHRFFPPGKIMHIINFQPDDAVCDDDSSERTSGSDDGQPEEPSIGIFLTPRPLYSKLRLSKTMISDHLMPVYRRQIEKLIIELENEEASSGSVL